MANWTIQSLIDANMAVTAYCGVSACNHHQVLDLDKLFDHLGPDAPAMADDLVPKLRCSVCGSKNVSLIYAPDDNKISGMGKNPYAKAKGG